MTQIYRRRISGGLSKKARTLDGVLALAIESYEPETPADLLQLPNGAMPDFLARVRAWAGAVLRAAGLPDDMRPVLVLPDGTWRELPDGWKDWPLERQIEQFPKGFDVCSVDLIAKQRMRESDELTMANHAADVVAHAWEMERAMADGDAAQAAACGVRLGEAWQRAIGAEHLEEAAVRGAKDLADRSRAAASRRKKTWWPNLAEALVQIYESNDDAWEPMPKSYNAEEIDGLLLCADDDRLFATDAGTGRESSITRRTFETYLANARKRLKLSLKK